MKQHPYQKMKKENIYQKFKKKYLSKDIKFNNIYSIPEDYFDPKLKYFAHNQDIFHANPHWLIIKFKIPVLEDLICNYVRLNYQNSRLDIWLRSKRVWGDVKFVSDGSYLNIGCKRLRFFGNTLIHVEDYFLKNKKITSRFLRDEVYKVVDRDWDFRVNKWYDSEVIYPISKAFIIHVYAPEDLSKFNCISKWRIYPDLIDNHSLEI